MAVSVLNSFASTNYLDGEIFTGEYFDVLRYAQIVVNITTTSATNSYDIRCYYSNDAITVNSIETFLITNQLNHLETFNATNRFIKIELEPHSTLLNLQVLTILKNQSKIQDVNCTIVQSEVLLVSNTQETALFIQADNTHAINVIADEDHPINVKADATHPLFVNNTQAQALFIQADNTHAINVIADEDHPINVRADTTHPLFVNNTQAQALFIQADTSHPVYIAIPDGAVIDAKITESVNLTITNTGFNSNITNAFLTVKNKPTYSVSLNLIELTSQPIRTSAGVLHTVVISSIPIGTAFDYLKF